MDRGTDPAPAISFPRDHDARFRPGSSRYGKARGLLVVFALYQALFRSPCRGSGSTEEEIWKTKALMDLDPIQFFFLPEGVYPSVSKRAAIDLEVNRERQHQ